MNDATLTGIAAPEPAGEPRAGTPVSIGSGYDLLEEVGRGGMGVVHRALDRGLAREVAVKLLQDRYAPDSAAAARFVEEARITAQLQHPGIPAVYQVGTWDDGRPFLAMKLIKGRTLEELLKDEGPSPTRWLGRFESVCQAVGYAHAHGVIHRDLKPANVMVGAFGEVQVMDWGLAKFLSPATPSDAADAGRASAASDEAPSLRESSASFTQVGSVLGTPAFMPPEQARGAGESVDCRSDVFGLGAVLCALLTGAPPFGGASAQSVWRNAAAGRTEEALGRLDASGADSELIALCKRCLATDPAVRPATATEVATAVAGLRQAADERAEAAERERLAAAVREGEQQKRRKAIIAGGAALIVVLVLGVAGTAVGMVKAHRERAEAKAAEADAQAAEAEARRLGAVAERERGRAAARLGKAVEAIEKAVNRAGTARWARDPALAAERRRVLEDALAFYEGFGEADDPVIRRETAVAYRRIGGAYLLLADYPKAGDYLGRARVLCEGLVADFPDDPRFVADLAEARLFAANEAASAGRAGDALAVYRDAVAAARRAAATAPSDDARQTLVSCLIGYGFFTMQSEPRTAGPLFRDALREVDELLARPECPFATRALAVYAIASVAIFDFNAGRPADGLAKVRRASTLVAETIPDPAAPAHYRDLFDMTDGLLKTMDGMALATAQPARAVAQLRAGAEVFDGLLAVYPNAFQYRSYQIMILNQEVRLLTSLGRTEDAERRRAELMAAADVVLKTSPSTPFVRQMVANQRSFALVHRVQAGEVADLDRRVDDLLATAGRDPNLAGVRYNAACALAQAARSAPPEPRERWAARAVALLTELLDGPFYRGPTNPRHIDTDADLDPVRTRSDFRAFRAELWKRFPPPPAGAPAPRPKPEK
ncbi:serine/threonine protein kinase [Gemmata sp. JC673]|uniref:Serine/threonine protein kinase n=1 Tax=Gemmata algarum TaxID=2975278 RepID=A0ABU5F2B1_9BACT|nr:serine/threonine-protein kinase [Gemmata algarum]MDY3561278.1 serine/threonine protein kinase [Gemmata algarum]